MIAPRVDTAERPRVRQQVQHQAPAALAEPIDEPALLSEAPLHAAGPDTGTNTAGPNAGPSASGTLTAVETLPAVESFSLTVRTAGDALTIDGPPVETLTADGPATPRVGARATRRALRARALRRRRQYAAVGIALLVGSFGATVAVLDLVH
jgi:hypothetical protein